MSDMYAGFEPEGMAQHIQTGAEASPRSFGMDLDIGDLVESIPDRKWGTVETVACGPRGCFYGVRFVNNEAAVRSRAQLRLATSFSGVGVGKMPFGDLFTPGEMKADIAALNGRVKAFGDDVSGTPSNDEKVLDYRRRFSAWFNQYFEWFRGIDGTFSYSLNSTRDRARQYSDELTAWVNEWKGMGGKVVSETAIAPPVKDIGGRGREQRESGSVLETLTTGALIVGGGALGILLLSKLMDSRRGRAQAQES